ncbi:MAG: TonB-dependent receptor, partial [Candidatus Methylumidiphilus sp.]
PLAQTVANTARPVTVLTQEELVTKAGNTIGATLQQEPGVTSQSFGPGVGAPVIRGQTGPRVRVMQNGIGNNDASALSPDHANSVEPVLAERVEVLRGPATLLYGSGAIGGVVNVLDNRIPEQRIDRPFRFDGQQNYDSVSSETTSMVKMEGGKDGVAYHLDGFYRDRGNTHIGGEAIDEAAARATDPSLEGVYPLQNSYGAILNTQARASGGTAGLSYIGEAGFLGASVNQLDNTYGIPPDGAGGPTVRVDLTQTKYDFKSEWKAPFAFAEALKLKFGYTDYQHQEIEGGVVGTTWKNQSYESRLEMPHKPLGPLRGVVGFQSINSDFQAIGVEAVVPKSLIDTYGLFAVEAFDVGPVTYELGVRVEHQSISPENLSGRNFLPISGSASGLWKINDQHQMSLGFTQSQRAPAVQELYTYGVHNATHSFEIGDAHLNKEVSYNLDLGYRFKADWLNAEINVFNNWVNNYIYQRRDSVAFNTDQESFEDICSDLGACLPVYRSSQADATFKGFEAKLVLPLMENHYGLVDLTLFGDYTRGEFSSGGDVPRMPPLRYGFQLDYAQNDWSANLRLTRGEPQDNPGDNESKTAGYLLLGVGAQYHVKALKVADVTVFAKGNNLLNENIRNSTSYLRNFAPEPGRGAMLGLRISY